MATEENLATQEVTNEAPEVAKVEESLDTRDIVAREVEKLEKADKVEDKPRDEKGKFAQKGVVNDKPEATEPTDKDEPKDVAKDEKTEVKPEKPARNPFSAWKKEAQEKLSGLPPEVQELIIEREGQFHKGIEKYKSEAHLARNIEKAIAPHKDYMLQLGVTPEIAFANLLQTERTLRTGSKEQKAALFRQLAHDYQIDASEVAQMPFDPQMHQLQSELAQLRNQMGSTQASQQSAEVGQIEQTIEQFAQSHEYFDDVKLHMADLLDKGFATDLDDAYTKAVRLNDDVFSKFQATQFENSKRQEALKADQAAKAAKAAAVSVRGAPTGATHNPTPSTTEEAVRMAMRQHGLIN